MRNFTEKKQSGPSQLHRIPNQAQKRSTPQNPPIEDETNLRDEQTEQTNSLRKQTQSNLNRRKPSEENGRKNFIAAPNRITQKPTLHKGTVKFQQVNQPIIRMIWKIGCFFSTSNSPLFRFFFSSYRLVWYSHGGT